MSGARIKLSWLRIAPTSQPDAVASTHSGPKRDPSRALPVSRSWARLASLRAHLVRHRMHNVIENQHLPQAWGGIAPGL